MIKIPQVKKDKYYVWEAVIILGLSIIFLASLAIGLYWYVFDYNSSVQKAKIENAYKHPYTYPKYQFDNLLKDRLFRPSK